MHRIDAPSATPEDQFTEGSPAGGVPATTVSAAWLNDVQEELMTLLEQAGITPVKGTQDQVFKAVKKLMLGQGDASPNGYIKVPFRNVSTDDIELLIFAWGQVTGAAAASGSGTAPFPTTFPSLVLFVGFTDIVSGTASACLVSQGQGTTTSTLEYYFNGVGTAPSLQNFRYFALGK